MNIFAILAVVGIATLVVAEILISVQKSQMKKQFLEELDRHEKAKEDANGSFKGQKWLFNRVQQSYSNIIRKG